MHCNDVEIRKSWHSRLCGRCPTTSEGAANSNLICEIILSGIRDWLKQPESPESALLFHRSVDICVIHTGGESLPEVNGCDVHCNEERKSQDKSTYNNQIIYIGWKTRQLVT